MNEPRPVSKLRGAFYGLITGWLIGMLWWVGLIIALGTFGLVLNAPLAGLPWGIVGLVAGFVASWCRSIWVAVAALFGGVCGGIYAVAINPFDGWLAPSMLLNGIFGSFLGLLVGVVSSFARAAWRT